MPRMWSSIPSSWRSAFYGSPKVSGASASSLRPIAGLAAGFIPWSPGPSSRRLRRARRWQANNCGANRMMPKSCVRRKAEQALRCGRPVMKPAVASRLPFGAVAPAMAAMFLFPPPALPAAAQSQTDLARAYQIIASKTFVDLTHSFGPGTPVWSGFGQAKFSPAADPKTHEPYTIPKDGFRATYYEMVGQYGTHVDPPAHFAENGITMDEIPLKQMILPLVVLDDTPYLAKDPDHAFSIDDLKAWERQHGRVPKGAFAALRTDMYKDWDADPKRFERSPFPAWAF